MRSFKTWDAVAWDDGSNVTTAGDTTYYPGYIERTASDGNVTAVIELGLPADRKKTTNSNLYGAYVVSHLLDMQGCDGA